MHYRLPESRRREFRPSPPTARRVNGLGMSVQRMNDRLGASFCGNEICVLEHTERVTVGSFAPCALRDARTGEFKQVSSGIFRGLSLSTGVQ
jgi:hypothetical protein